MSDLALSQWLLGSERPETVKRRIASFGRRFGEAHLTLACHAAFPLALTSDLLYRLWANFQRDIHGEILNIPWIAVADLLLSNLCDEVSQELYEMNASVRAELLNTLRTNPNFGQQRIEEVSNFLYKYVQHQLDSHNPDIRDFARAQQWTALAYTRPSDAARELALALSSLSQNNKVELIRMASLIETLAEPLATFTPLLAYARGTACFARDDIEGAVAQFSRAAGGGYSVEFVGVSLPIPKQLSERIREAQGDSRPTPQAQNVAQGETVQFSVIGIDIKTGEHVLLPQVTHRQGLYIIGAAGTGKSTLIENLILQDIEQGLGVCFLDPHGEAIETILARIPSHRERDVILLDPLDRDYAFGLNLYQCDDPADPAQSNRTASYVMQIFAKLFADADFSNMPRMAQVLRNTTLTLIENPGATVTEIPLLLQDEVVREKLTKHLTDAQLRLFWNSYDRMKPQEQREMTNSTLNKVDEILALPGTLHIVGQSTTTLNFRSIMDEGKILLVRLPSLYEQISSLIGSVIISQILNAAYSRPEIPSDRRRQFSLYADEYQKFATPDFAVFLAEGRKFTVATTVAHQRREQLDPTNRSATLRVANVVVFRVSSQDADELAKEFDSTPPPPEVINMQPTLTIVQNNIGYLLKNGHTNPVVNEFAKGKLREIERLSNSAEDEERRSNFRGLLAELNRLFYQVMVEKNTDSPILADLAKELDTINADDEPLFEEFLMELNSVLQALANEPIVVESGQYTPVYGSPRTYVDMQNRIAEDLTNLRPYTARCRIGETEATIQIPPLPTGLSNEALQERIERIQKRTQVNYCRKRTDIENEIKRRIEEYKAISRDQSRKAQTIREMGPEQEHLNIATNLPHLDIAVTHSIEEIPPKDIGKKYLSKTKTSSPYPYSKSRPLLGLSFEERLQLGAENVVRCMGVTSRDRVFIMTDYERESIARRVAIAALDQHANVTIRFLEHYGERPLTAFPEELRNDLLQAHPTVTYYIATAKPGEIAFRIPLLPFLAKELKVRHGHMIGIDEEVMTQGMCADYDEVFSLTNQVYDLVRNAKTIHVTSAKGSDVTATFHKNWKWIPCHGRYVEQGEWGNLPEGEVLTAPASVDGVLVCDVLGDFFLEKYRVLQRPIVIIVKGGYVSEITSQDAALAKEVHDYLFSTPNGNRVGEFAIGTLTSLKAFIGNILQDEKMPGLHVAFGDPYPQFTGANWNARVHVDVIPSRCTIEVDGRVIMRDGEFTI